MARELTQQEQERRAHWGRVHMEADRRPLLKGLFPRLGRYMGEGCRREKGRGGFDG
jgi:hypothetical protein